MESFQHQFQQLDDPAEQLRWLTQHRFLGVLDLLVERGLISTATQRLAAPLVAKRGRVPPWQLDQERRVLAGLVAAGVPSLALKGCLLAYLVYPAPDQRWRSDLDVLVAPAALERARAALESLGFEPMWRVAGGTPIDQESWLLRRDRRRFVLDLHWAMRKHPLLRDRLNFDEQWRAAVELPALAPGVRGQAPIHALLNASLHWFDGIYAEPQPLGWLLDQDLLWRRLDDGERRQLALLADERGVAGLLGESLRMTADFLATPIPPAFLDDLSRAGRDQRATRLIRIGRSPARAYAYALWCEPGLRRKLHRLTNSLFPPAAHMRERFPEGSRLGLPGLYLRRWFRRWPRAG